MQYVRRRDKVSFLIRAGDDYALVIRRRADYFQIVQ